MTPSNPNFTMPDLDKKMVITLASHIENTWSSRMIDNLVHELETILRVRDGDE